MNDNSSLAGWIEGWMDGWMEEGGMNEGWMDGRKEEGYMEEGGMEGRTGESMYLSTRAHTCFYICMYVSLNINCRQSRKPINEIGKKICYSGTTEV